MYKPKPINTKDIKLSDDILELSELLAKNTHENWSQERIDQGWSYGEKRDDDKKYHPGLIPYEDLSEGEKDFDRRTSMETLKAILSLGYKIEKI